MIKYLWYTCIQVSIKWHNTKKKNVLTQTAPHNTPWNLNESTLTLTTHSDIKGCKFTKNSACPIGTVLGYIHTYTRATLKWSFNSWWVRLKWSLDTWATVIVFLHSHLGCYNNVAGYNTLQEHPPRYFINILYRCTASFCACATSL